MQPPARCSNHRCVYIDQCELICVPTAGFALGFIFLSPPFSPIRFFCAIFLNLEPDFWPFFAQKEPGYRAFFAKKVFLLSLTPLILVDYSIHIDTITMG